jgi:predicted ATP-grasp superfamily ATP-dependent carboligase
MHKRLHEYPISGGASTLRESIFNDELKDAALKILKNLQWHGVAMVEFKLDKKDNKPKLIEINGRFWGSLALSIAAGIDFPYLLHQMVMGKSFTTSFNYETGIKCRWLLPGELLWLFASLKNNNNKLLNFWDFVSNITTNDDILSRDDVMPSFGAMIGLLHQFGSVIQGKRNISGELV